MLKTITLAILLLGSSSTIASTTPNESKNTPIKIDIISDVVCPWCAIGFKRLDTAIKELDMEDEVTIVWHPFQLNPTMIKEGINADQYLMKKMRLSEAELKQKRKYVANTANASGFKFNYHDTMHKPNTLYSHILLDYAKEHGKQTELKTRLQAAYFTEKKNIGLKSVLAAELEAVGLDAEEGMARLESKSATEKVQKEELYWKNRGVSSIPTIVFEGSGIVKGARSVATYKKILRYLAKQKTPT